MIITFASLYRLAVYELDYLLLGLRALFIYFCCNLPLALFPKGRITRTEREADHDQFPLPAKSSARPTGLLQNPRLWSRPVASQLVSS